MNTIAERYKISLLEVTEDSINRRIEDEESINYGVTGEDGGLCAYLDDGTDRAVIRLVEIVTPTYHMFRMMKVKKSVHEHLVAPNDWRREKLIYMYAVQRLSIIYNLNKITDKDFIVELLKDKFQEQRKQLIAARTKSKKKEAMSLVIDYRNENRNY